MKRRVIGRSCALCLVVLFAASIAGQVRADTPTIELSRVYDVDRLELEGNASTSPATFHELLSRALPTTMTARRSSSSAVA